MAEDSLKDEWEELTRRLDLLEARHLREAKALREALADLAARLPERTQEAPAPSGTQTGPPAWPGPRSEPAPPAPPAVTGPPRMTPEIALSAAGRAHPLSSAAALPAVTVPLSAPSLSSPPVPVPEAGGEEAGGSFELRFGRVWLVRFGVALLVTGLVLLGNFAYKNWIHDLPAGVRLAALYLGSLLLSGVGILVARRESTQRFGEVVLAGGLAFFYWCTFAAHHVGRLRVIESPVLAGVLLLGAAAVMVAVSLRRGSRAIAVLGILLASYSTVLQPLGWLSAASNAVLAGAGVLLMRKPGWSASGIAAMAGTYLSFLWWQIGGANGGRPEDDAALWFLPPVWLLFALPGVTGIGKSFGALSDRLKLSLAAGNNTAFFVLFSALWLSRFGWSDYWQVPAVFGAVLSALGVVGRWRESAGGLHLVQGLGLMTAAMMLKLEGFHLELALAVQTLVLAAAFRRTHARTELVFAVIAGGLAGWLTLSATAGPGSMAGPLWSHAAVALLLTGAGALARGGLDRWEGPAREAGRHGVSLLVLTGLAVGLLAWCLKLPSEWQAPVAVTLSSALGALALKVDRQGRLGEWVGGACAFAIAALATLLFDPGASWTPWVTGALALGGNVLWRQGRRAPAYETDLIQAGPFIAGILALAVTVASYQGIHALDSTPEVRCLWYGLAGLLLTATGRHLARSPMLAVAGALMLPGMLLAPVMVSHPPDWLLFAPVAAACGLIALVKVPAPGDQERELHGAAGIGRIVAVVAWSIAWLRLAPGAWGDIIAAGALALALVGRYGPWRKVVAEVAVFQACALMWLAVKMTGEPWHLLATPPGWRGGMVVLVTLVLPLAMGRERFKAARQGVLLAGAVLLSMWATQQLVWAQGWKPVVVLWTLLGFGFVSAGLWQRWLVWRQAGFALLACALLKLFCIDVWDFNAFMRVTAFLALGAALVVLGFFYNRFAEVLKRLMEE